MTFLGHNLLLSRASFFMMELRLSRSLSHKLFPFFKMEFWLSRRLSHELFFHDGILAITKPFSWTFFFFHDGILAITKPFSRTFFFFHDGILTITKPFSRTFFFFHDGILAIRNLGEDSFHIYYKEYLHRIRLVKNLASWFRAPLQGKEYGPSYSNTTRKRKANVFFPKSLIDTWFGFF
jgi:hypothetical protein